MVGMHPVVMVALEAVVVVIRDLLEELEALTEAMEVLVVILGEQGLGIFPIFLF